MKVNPEPRQHTQGLDAGSVILQTVHHGLRARSSVLWREQMITRRPCSCPATHRHKIRKPPSTQRGRLNNKLRAGALPLSGGARLAAGATLPAEDGLVNIVGPVGPAVPRRGRLAARQDGRGGGLGWCAW